MGLQEIESSAICLPHMPDSILGNVFHCSISLFSTRTILQTSSEFSRHSRESQI
jgi:hypothetical protein